MATRKSTELSETEIELKRRGRRRLIGAATIGLMGIVFLPMIFDGEPKHHSSNATSNRQEISVQLPAKDGVSILPSPSAATSSRPAPPLPVAAEPIRQAAPEVAKVVSDSTMGKAAAVVLSAKPEKSAPPVKSQSAIAEKTGFAVQLGVFSDAENAKQTIAKMKDAKLPVYTDSIPVRNGTATRVRIGPFTNREKADSALAQVKLAGSDGKIISLQ